MQTFKILLIIYLIAIPSFVFSQDILFLKNGEEIQSIVLEIENKTIKYKKYENRTGPTYNISRSNISGIKYQNGEQEMLFYDETKTPEIIAGGYNATEMPTRNLSQEEINAVKNEIIADINKKIEEKKDEKTYSRYEPFKPCIMGIVKDKQFNFRFYRSDDISVQWP